MRFTPYAAAFVLALVAACGGTDGGGGTTPTKVVSRVTVTGATSTINSGETLQLTAAAFDNAGAPITSAGNFSWSSSANTVAAVDQAGKVTGNGAGTAVITAGVSGVSGTLSVTVRPVSGDTVFSIGTNSFSPTFLPVAVGSTVVFSLGFDGIGHDVRFDAKNGAPLDIPVTVRANVARKMTVAGDFPYFCPTHPQMIGTITVR